ncbi:MAG: hypothetical protein Q7S28_01505 [bacterium]|nr:hypothetical protein [bacterium]
MLSIRRSDENPVLLPNPNETWEAEAVFNPSVTKMGNEFHAVFRAQSRPQKVEGVELEVSVIGHAVSKDGVHFGAHKPLIAPQEPWERFGCEDPRVTKLGDTYYIFYTAISTYPFSADGIRVAVALTKDFKHIEERHLVTPFNAKAMGLFPELVNGKVAAILTAHTDSPPAKICLAFFDKPEDIWSEKYWADWHANIDAHVLHIDHNEHDHIEIGSAPIKTSKGWLVFYSYIFNYFAPPVTFGIQALLLDLKNPTKIVGKVKRPFMIPEEEYELYGRLPNIIFPSGALIQKKNVYLYYGATDTVSCLAVVPLDQLLKQLTSVVERELHRYHENPILLPNPEHPWEAKAVFNPAAWYDGERVHILYRASAHDDVSTFGYATTADGIRIDERLQVPVYVPREPFENRGCEDPRLTELDGRLYLLYTAFGDIPRVALSSISKDDFLAHQWNWTSPVLISPPDMGDDKDAALFPKKINGKYVFLHRLGTEIWIDESGSLDFDGQTKFLKGKILMGPRESAWDSKKIGIAGPPIETKEGWLLLYHGVSRRTGHYSVRAALLDRDDPSKILRRVQDTILDPAMPYEREGIVPNVVFPCGTAVIGKKLFVYYGGADKVIGVATIALRALLKALKA